MPGSNLPINLADLPRQRTVEGERIDTTVAYHGKG